jgi:hypothetical protein
MLKYYEKAVFLYEKIGKESIEWAITLKNIGLIYYDKRKC